MCIRQETTGNNEMPDRLEDDWLWLSVIPDLYRREKMLLLRYFGDPASVRQASREEFALWERTGRVWVQKLYPWLTQADGAERRMKKVTEQMKRKDIHFVSCQNSAFPAGMRELPECPYGLFYVGRLPVPDLPAVAMVGARACSSYGAQQAGAISRKLAAAGMQIVSGMAEGIDGISQQAAIRQGGESFAVLGSGADVCYPRGNIDLYEALKSRGGIISEFPPGTRPLKYHFPMRNRIISALADVLIVIEARRKSGTLITVDYALDYGRDVYTLPGRSTDTLSDGCNRLIADGAHIILSPDDVAEELSQRFFKDRKNGEEEKQISSFHKELMLAPEDDLVYSNLDLSPSGLEKISSETGLTAHKVAASLLHLQMRGLVTEVAKNHYIRI